MRWDQVQRNPPSSAAFAYKDPRDVATRTLYVDNRRSDLYTPEGTYSKPFRTVQDAVDVIQYNQEELVPGYLALATLINVAPGTYLEDVEITEPVALFAEVPNTVVVQSVTATSCGVCNLTNLLIGALVLDDVASVILTCCDMSLGTAVISNCDVRIADGTRMISVHFLNSTVDVTSSSYLYICVLTQDSGELDRGHSYRFNWTWISGSLTTYVLNVATMTIYFNGAILTDTFDPADGVTFYNYMGAITDTFTQGGSTYVAKGGYTE